MLRTEISENLLWSFQEEIELLTNDAGSDSYKINLTNQNRKYRGTAYVDDFEPTFEWHSYNICAIYSLISFKNVNIWFFYSKDQRFKHHHH